jgi:endo-1,4-beta-mannosidase
MLEWECVYCNYSFNTGQKCEICGLDRELCNVEEVLPDKLTKK